MRGAMPPHLRYYFVAWCLVKHMNNLGAGIAQWYGAGLRAG
jgi:hypothetical protein